MVVLRSKTSFRDGLGRVKTNIFCLYFFLDEKVPKNQDKTMLLPALPDTNPCGKVSRNGTGWSLLVLSCFYGNDWQNVVVPFRNASALARRDKYPAFTLTPARRFAMAYPQKTHIYDCGWTTASGKFAWYCGKICVCLANVSDPQVPTDNGCL